MLSQHQSDKMQWESPALPRLVGKLPKKNPKFRENTVSSDYDARLARYHGLLC